MDPIPGVFRWNVNPTWEHFSSLVREASEASEAPSEFHRNHHLRSALYFAIGAIEALLNREMRKHLVQTGVSEDAILSKLKKTAFREKATSWPDLLCEKAYFPEGLLEALIEYNSLRGEVTHEKAKDHALYARLDTVEPQQLVRTTRDYFVGFYEAAGRSYDYWLHGWNFIGEGGDPRRPCLFGNQQFVIRLRHMGLDGPSTLVHELEAWEREFMTTQDGFAAVSRALDGLDCEPRDSRFEFMPRLCKRWSDDGHVASCGIERSLQLPVFIQAPPAPR